MSADKFVEIKNYFDSFRNPKSVEIAILAMTGGHRGGCFQRKNLKEALQSTDEQVDTLIRMLLKSALIFPRDRYYRCKPILKKVLLSYLSTNKLRQDGIIADDEKELLEVRP